MQISHTKMTNLYINNTKVPEVFNTEINELLNNLNIKSQDNNVSIEIELPNYSIDDVTHSYIYNLGTLSYDKCEPTSKNAKIMIALYLKYPQYVYLKDNNLSDEQINSIFRNEYPTLSVLKPIHLKETNTLIDQNGIEYYEKHKESYDKSFNKIVDILFKRYSYDNIVYRRNDASINTKVDILKTLISRKTVKYVKVMYDVENQNYIRLDHRYMDVNFNSLLYRKHPYGYKDGMKVINSREELFKELKVNSRNLYINCDLVINGSMDDNPILDVASEDLATWAIGPNCRQLQSILNFVDQEEKFSNTPPQINGWAVEHLVNCDNMLDSSNVEDLSDMNFFSCKNATGMLGCCNKLTKAPKFYNLVDCSFIFYGTKVESVDDSIINTENIENMEAAFAHLKCENVLNNKRFKKLKELDIGSLFQCGNIKSALNNCTFDMLENIKSNDKINVESLLNNCEFNKPIDIDIFNTSKDNICKCILNDCNNRLDKEIMIKNNMVVHISNAVDVLQNVRYVFVR